MEPDASAAGRGRVQVEWVAGRSVPTRVMATSPLRLLTPRRAGPGAWLYATTYGGGLLQGDDIDLEIHVAASATCVLATQASTKVFRSPSGAPSRQELRAQVEPDALLVVTPDPVTCFRDACYEQVQRFDLAGNASLVLVDWMTSGRRARGETWAFSRYASRNEIRCSGQPVLADAVRLDPAQGPLPGAVRLGRYHCLALLVLVGAGLATASSRLLERVAALPIEPGADLLESASPLGCGAILRILGTTTQSVAHQLKEYLEFLEARLGETPWARKW